MKRPFLAALLLLAGVVALAQNYPSEWRQFTSDGYFHDIESGTNKQSALDLARTNLAHQIQMKVKEVSQMDKQAVNGRSSILYRSSKSFSTDVDMSLVETKSFYNDEQSKYYVLVYIDKAASSIYYENEVKMLISKADNTLTIADNYISTGFKQKAKVELQKALQLFDSAGKPFFWLNVFGFNEYKIQNFLKQVNEKEQTIKQKLSDLEYGTTYCVVCEADLFGRRYVKLGNEVKGELAASGCNFVDNPTTADIVIRIQASARKYNDYQGAYFTYIDAAVTIDKTATGQRIFEDEISTKGTHTLSYDEAARDGYKQIKKDIVKHLKENIKL
ncbi:MAG: hypothetical protein IJ081_00030 [Prevotella sp.]|nr:hypothetical protein [Prevotella sp.]